MQWMFVSVIMYYLSFIIHKIIAYYSDYGQHSVGCEIAWTNCGLGKTAVLLWNIFSDDIMP